MAEPFIGEIRLFGGNFAPRGWALCDGQLMSISQNAALFSILGNAYGGDGKVTFALPDLRGRTPVHVGPTVTRGEAAGQETHTLTIAEMPQHTHTVHGSSAAATQAAPAGGVWGVNNAAKLYSTAGPDTTLNAAALPVVGGSQAHSNMQPYLALNFCIAVVGIFPPRS